MEKSLQYLEHIYDNTPLENDQDADMDVMEIQEREAVLQLKSRLEARPKAMPSRSVLTHLMHTAAEATVADRQAQTMMKALYGESVASNEVHSEICNDATYRNMEATKHILETRVPMQPRAETIQRILAAAEMQAPTAKPSVKPLVPVHWLHRPAIRWTVAACVSLLAVVGLLRMETDVFKGNTVQAEVIEIYAPAKRIFAWNDRAALTPIYQQVADLETRVQPHAWGERALPEMRIVVPEPSNTPEVQTVQTK